MARDRSAPGRAVYVEAQYLALVPGWPRGGGRVGIFDEECGQKRRIYKSEYSENNKDKGIKRAQASGMITASFDSRRENRATDDKKHFDF